MYAAAVAVLTTLPTVAQNTDNECTFDTCKAGTRALTYYQKTDPYYICPTREIGNYVTTVIGLMAMQAILGVGMPNISDKTGEPEYTGQTKTMVDGLREKAGVQTFDQALARCSAGADKRLVVVLNMPEDLMVAYVEDERRKLAFWMPIVHLDKLK